MKSFASGCIGSEWQPWDLNPRILLVLLSVPSTLFLLGSILKEMLTFTVFCFVFFGGGALAMQLMGS